jgi:hypothetical protein
MTCMGNRFIYAGHKYRQTIDVPLQPLKVNRTPEPSN